MRWKVLHASPLVSITEVHCRGEHAACGEEEASSAHKLVFPRAGVFVKHVRGECVVADPAHVVFFNAWEPYRVSHPVPGGDDCLSFEFEDAVLLETLGAHDPSVEARAEAPFHTTHRLVNPASLLPQQALRHRLRKSMIGSLEAEETALALLDDVVRSDGADRPERARRPRAASARVKRERIEAAKVLIAGRPDARLGLGEIARVVHSTPYHLAREFRAAAGLPVHQYQLRVRLSLALERLLDRPDSLLTLALDLGFASHSHFAAAFKRQFGLSPSAFRRAANGARVREMRKILTA
jgi:AraC-like DNA-binding protein